MGKGKGKRRLSHQYEIGQRVVLTTGERGIVEDYEDDDRPGYYVQLDLPRTFHGRALHLAWVRDAEIAGPQEQDRADWL